LVWKPHSQPLRKVGWGGFFVGPQGSCGGRFVGRPFPKKIKGTFNWGRFFGKGLIPREARKPFYQAQKEGPKIFRTPRFGKENLGGELWFFQLIGTPNSFLMVI